ncbi:DEAD/DEAH box helicase [Dysgonomonas massiliensis]|uniref:DEAD/DEAH box helicase n=1 Tax=Dysgonomonas massiliensis TaxID=2040292 RepID=UPI001359983F|nr:DEAD/DEAH box helicase [Dysgonomonas massiliensis]
MEHYNKLYNHQTLNSVINQQIIKILSRKINIHNAIETSDSDLRKAIWISSILAGSNDETHLKKVQDFAILLFLNNNSDVSILKIVYILFSRIGNLTATNFLKGLLLSESETFEQSSHFNEDVILTKELMDKRLDNSFCINNKPYLLTDFQKNLLKSLEKERHISISAPTSSGKSFILKKYIEDIINDNNKFCVLYIVPSKALINQVSEELRLELPDVIIKNAFLDKNEEEENQKLIYVITPERTIKIINSKLGMQLPDLIFIDEIQNVEDEQGRGNLFEYVYEELAKIKKENIKIITAGPYISNPGEIYNELFNRKSTNIYTQLSPVFQLKIILDLGKDDISLKLYDSKSTTSTLTNVIQIPNIKQMFDKNIGSGLSSIIKVLSTNDDCNLIYSSDGNYAERWALKYADTIEIKDKLETELTDLIRYIKTEIHEQYYLIPCLKKRVAFHHSSLPEFVRKEVESLFKQGIINTLFCTSTLLEGVNLPADNLFIVRAKKNNNPLSDFEFGNLIGRAGRLSNSLYGTIYCLSQDNKTEWAEQYYSANYTKEVIPFSSKVIKEITVDDLSETEGRKTIPKIKNLITSLRNRALNRDKTLNTFLDKQNIDSEKKQQIIATINDSVKDVTIPYSIIRQNPTIDPLLQDKLYKRIKEDGIAQWVIHPNSNFLETFNREMSEKLIYSQKSFYWQLDSIINRLDAMYNITYEILIKDKISLNTNAICINAIKWLESKSIKELISNRIQYFSTEEMKTNKNWIDTNKIEDINKAIKDVIKINSNVITFSLLKYLKLLTDILNELLSEEEKEEYKLSLALPIQLELGTQEPLIISLITNGIPRTIAIKLFRIFKKTDECKADTDVFDWLKKQTYIDGLDPIYNKFLKQNNFIDSLKI